MATSVLSRPLPEDVVLEVGDSRNRNLMWPLTQDVLRGWWKMLNLIGAEVTEEFTQRVPDLPGIRIEISATKKMARIFDPLATVEHASTLVRLNSVAKHSTIFGFSLVEPEKTREFQLLSQTDLKTWLYWARRVVDAKHAVIVSGKLGTLAEIEALPGKTRIGLGNSSGRTQFREDCANTARLSAEVLV